MTQYFARIVNGAVDHIEQVPDGLMIGVDIFAPAYAKMLVPATEATALGQAYTDGAFGPAPAPPVPPPSAYIVTDLQFRLALNQSGLRDAAESYIASATQDVRDWWDRATHIHSDDAKLNAAVKALGKTAADRDALFTLAASL